MTMSRGWPGLLVAGLAAALLLSMLGGAGQAAAAEPPIPERDWQAIPPAPAPHSAAANPETIGVSVEGRPIRSYRFGRGATDIIFVGGLHGGFEWNTAILAQWFIDYFGHNPERIPPTVTVHIIPVANPDGLFAATGKAGDIVPSDIISDTAAARFNANGVDLNRNWDCEWSADAVWGTNAVSGGDEPFSEPESVALRDYFLRIRPAAVVFWHSAAAAVYASGCDGLYEPSRELANLYGKASGYQSQRGLSLYKITGDAGNWLATQDIPAVAVELISRRSLDLARNVAGVTAVLTHYADEVAWPGGPTRTQDDTGRRVLFD